jgi:uncharacterized membrane protein
MSDGTTSTTSEGLSDNVAGALAYVTLLPAIIFLLIAPYNKKPFVKFHALQCLGLYVIAIFVFVVLGIFSFVLAFIPFIHFLAFIFFPLFGGLFSLALLILWVMCVLKAYQGSAFKIPGIASFAAKQSGYNG